MRTDLDAGLWLRRFHPSQEATARLVCFPHAGGSAAFYFPLSAFLHPQVEVVAVQYPGRQERHSEAPAPDIETLAEAVAAVLAPSWDTPTAFFGHSMGALVAYETARLLRAGSGTAPTEFFASGRRAPSALRDERLHLAADRDLLAELVRQGGTPQAVLDDPELVELILPALRADYRAVETYRHRPGAPLDTPVTVLVGTDDPKVTPAEAHAWQDHTTGPTEVLTFSGGHFFVLEHRDRIGALVRDRLTQRS
ncbi:thioesterase II family protein [Streptomyces sp. NPDC101175]|uniref:thioesterase II family protein n=1 Tax=Streptomyces sp. NPDC101175 TaxID=3366123 RepID=UPI003837880C